MPDGKMLVGKVLEIIDARAGGSLEGWCEAEADLLAAVTAHGIIGNGGLCYWYAGKRDEDTLRAAAAFERMQLVDAAEAMRRSREAFPMGAPSQRLEESQRFV